MTKKATGAPPRLLIADDDTIYREWLRHHLDVLYPNAAINVLALSELLARVEALSDRDCDIALLVACFGSSPEDPRAIGLEVLRKVRGKVGLPAFIAVAQEGNELTAVRAVQLGAADYLPKRLLTPERLSTSTQLVLRRIERRRVLSGLPLESRIQLPSGTPEAQEPAAAGLPDTRGRPALADSTADIPAVLPQTLIPGFTIQAKIGESDTSTVYLAASDELPGRPVALKVMKAPRDEATAGQLEREYSAIMAVQSPSIVMIYDYGVRSGREYLAMEYLPRGDLKARIQQGLTEQDALHYAQRVAYALRVIHAAGLVHRDLKPPNILLRQNNDVALIDFGLARPLDGTGESVSVVRGSPYYMSPEHALGEQLDARADFYSLGIMVYEMLTGKKPYTGNTALEVLQQHVSTPLPPLPPFLAIYQPLLERLLAKDREERFGTAEEIMDVLEQLEASVAPRAEFTIA
jgi:DNA-binding NarL/FixJ family response regulator